MNNRISLAVLAALGLAAGTVAADSVTFKNGDKLTGTVLEMVDGKLKFKSPAVGEILIDSVDVSTFSTDGLIDLQLADGTIVKQKVEAGDPGKISVTGEAGSQQYEISSLKGINPRRGWKGNLVGGFVINSGNTNNEAYHAAVNVNRRGDRDRINLGGAYNLTRDENSDGNKVSTTDNWFAYGQYDYFFNEKLYGFARLQVDHDYIANLQYRVTPSLGLGYQWMEGPVWNFNTEGGVAYVYEKYEDNSEDPNFDDDDSYIALRLAYHYDRKLNDKVNLFHNLEYVPGLDRIENFQLNADLGLRTELTANMFAEFKFEWKHDNSPAEGSLENDLRYIFGVGWAF